MFDFSKSYLVILVLNLYLFVIALELEAITSVRSALDKKDQGKISKAQKLFQHAMALCPRHPDVLTHYGEFYEETRQDYLSADHLYVLALSYSPKHTQALINRKRTLPGMYN